MESQRNTGIDNFFIDKIRFSAPTPRNAAAMQSFATYVHNSGQAERVIYTGKILWHPVDSDDVQDSLYLWGARELSRYESARYSHRLKYVSPTWQNNVQPYSRNSAIACITDILTSYRSVSSWAWLDYYLVSINLIYIEFGIDFASLTLPSLTQLIRYVSCGRGSASRYLRLYTSSVIYRYDKDACTWNAHIDDKTYRELVAKGDATLYIGSRNIAFKVYKKHNKTRVELAVKGRAQVLKFLNSPLSACPSRHITKLTDYQTIKYLSGCYLDRIAELFCGKIPAGAREAVDRALDTFRVSPIPDAWTVRETSKQELPPLPYGSPAKTAEEAIYIDTGRQGSFTLYGHNNAVLSSFPVHSVSQVLTVRQRIRAPPRLFPPVQAITQTLSMPVACMLVDLHVLLAYHLTQGLVKLYSHVYTAGHGAVCRSLY